MKAKSKVLVALSGGVDSSVAATLLKRAGFNLVGVFMKFWQEGDSVNRCCSVESAQRARRVAQKLDIPFYVLNVKSQFKKAIVDYFLQEYKAGRTPNPCVVCNKEIKFRFLIQKALELGCDFVATGHYARLEPQFPISNFQFPKKILQAKCQQKDQTYFLWRLGQKEISKIIFPVGDYTKPEVRQIAKKFGLPTAQTPESQEVCFIQGTTSDFLKKYLKTKQGNVIDGQGSVLGKHQGLWFYTIGQRKGLPLQQGPWFVVGKDFKKNILIVSKNERDLLQKQVFFNQVNWVSGRASVFPIKVKAKIRSKVPLADCLVYKNKAVFVMPQKAITPGQSIVFYKKEELLGGGIIC